MRLANHGPYSRATYRSSPMKTLLAFLSLLLISSAYAAEYDTRIEQAVKLIEAGQRAQAMDFFFEGNPYASVLDASYQSQRARFTNTPNELGDLQYSKKIGEYKLADSVVIVKYLVVYEGQPLLLNFKLFRKKMGWVGSAMGFENFDDVFADLAARDLLRGNSTQADNSRPSAKTSSPRN